MTEAMPLHHLLDTCLSAFFVDLDLLCDFTEPTDDFFVALSKPVDHIGNLGLGTELFDILLRLPQIVSRNARVQMVDGLELKPTVEEVEPGRAINIHGGSEHFLWEGLVCTHVGC